MRAGSLCNSRLNGGACRRERTRLRREIPALLGKYREILRNPTLLAASGPRFPSLDAVIATDSLRSGTGIDFDEQGTSCRRYRLPICGDEASSSVPELGRSLRVRLICEVPAARQTTNFIPDFVRSIICTLRREPRSTSSPRATSGHCQGAKWSRRMFRKRRCAEKARIPRCYRWHRVAPPWPKKPRADPVATLRCTALSGGPTRTQRSCRR